MVPPGRYRRGSVSHSWSETTLSENSTAGVSTPERLYTPVDELLTSAARLQQVRAASAAGDTSVPDDGPYTTRTNVVTAEYSDSRELSAEGGGRRNDFFQVGYRAPAASYQ